MSRLVHDLIEQAATEYVEDGLVSTDTVLRLGSAGYDIRHLDTAIAEIAHEQEYGG